MPSGTTITFGPLPPPKQQIRLPFPAPRRSVRRKAHTNVIPTLRKKQSSLTQVDFVSTPNARGDARDIPGDDEDYEDYRPKKKRRKSKFEEREAGQDSLTQMADRILPKKFELDEDGFQVWSDESESVLEIPETSQLAALSSPPADSGVGVTVAKLASKSRTPPRKHLKEIPSSQTPPSTKLSMHSSRCKPDVQRSPLKERSTNVPLNRASVNHARSQKLEKLPSDMMLKVPLNDISFRSPTQKRVASQAFDPGSFSPSQKRPLRKLRRVATVQDSQAEDLDLSNTVVVAGSPIKPTPRLKRVTTVQDSQYEDLSLLSDAVDPAVTAFDRFDEYDNQHTYGDYTQQATFDPVNAALDRDAARFRWTQTQARCGGNQQHEDSETDDDDLDRGCYQAPNLPTSNVPPRSPSIGSSSIVDTKEVAEDEVVEVCLDGDGNDHEIYVDAGEDDTGEATLVPEELVPSSPPVVALDMPPMEPEEAVPSSPPASCASQVSTVVPTQASLQKVLSDNDDADANADPLPDTMLSEAPTIAPFGSSPQQSVTGYHNLYTCSSLPLPPWSSPQQVPRMEAAATHEFKDWSLPPPPPMSSSRTRTPTSSSR